MFSPDLQRIQHICDYCSDIAQMLARFGNTYEAFQSDTAFQKIIAFDILQIGELSGKLSREYRIATADRVQWSLVKGVRNIVMHDYGSVDLEQLWEIVEADIPVLRAFCENQIAGADKKDAP